jgi:hypothetical protein
MAPAAVFFIFGFRDSDAFRVATARTFYGLGRTVDQVRQLDGLHALTFRQIDDPAPAPTSPGTSSCSTA